MSISVLHDRRDSLAVPCAIPFVKSLIAHNGWVALNQRSADMGKTESLHNPDPRQLDGYAVVTWTELPKISRVLRYSERLR